MSITTRSPATDRSAFAAGFIAAEGYFGASGRAFVLSVGLGASDGGMCASLRDLLCVGRVRAYPRRKPHYDDEVVFVVRRLRDLVEVVVPFMDEHLPLSYKRVQYLAWREQLLRYWDTSARRRPSCSLDGCEEPNRAHGLCRRHLWQMRRQ